MSPEKDREVAGMYSSLKVSLHHHLNKLKLEKETRVFLTS